MSIPIKLLLFAIMMVAAASSAGATDISLQRLLHLEEAFAANSNDASATRELAHAYALALLQADKTVATYAAAALDTSSNV